MNSSHVFFILATGLVCGAISQDTPQPKVKRGKTGGETKVDVNRFDVIMAAMFAVETLSDTHFIYQLQRITKATTQVMTGTMYRLVMDVLVAPYHGGKTEIKLCKVIVLEQDWQSPIYSLKEFDCSLPSLKA